VLNPAYDDLMTRSRRLDECFSRHALTLFKFKLMSIFQQRLFSPSGDVPTFSDLAVADFTAKLLSEDFSNFAHG
jgi:hypothetical protein